MSYKKIKFDVSNIPDEILEDYSKMVEVVILDYMKPFKNKNFTSKSFLDDFQNDLLQRITGFTLCYVRFVPSLLEIEDVFSSLLVYSSQIEKRLFIDNDFHIVVCD